MKKKFFCFAFISAFLLSMTSVPSAIAAEDESFKVFGYTHFWFLNDNSSTPAVPTAVDDQFLMRRSRMGVKGHSKIGVLPVKYKLLMEFAESKGGVSANLLDAYLDLNIHPLFNVGMGQFKYHFMEIGTASSKIKAIGLAERPEISNNIHSTLLTTGSILRDVGFRIHGKDAVNDFKFGYDVEVINGKGGNKAELNDGKTVVVHAFGSMMDFTLFGAYFTGDLGPEGTTGTGEDGWTIGGKYKKGPIWIQGEYAEANPDSSVDPSGWYIMGAYSITPEWQGVIRYDVADMNNNVSSMTMDTVGLGVNFKVNKHATLSANYYIRDADSGYAERTHLSRGTTGATGSTASVMGGAVGDLFLFQAEMTY